MYAHHLPIALVRALAPPRLAAGVVVTLALLSAACSESASSLTSPSLLPRSSDVSSAAAPAFAVLGNAAVTCTDGNISGNVGTFHASPTGSITQTTCPITGALQVGDEAAKQAFTNFLSTYSAIAPKLGDVCTSLTGTLGGVTLAPGAYCFDVAATVTGVLTLDGPSDGVWTFNVGASGTGALTGTNFLVAMAGGGQACNVTWWVADATTMTTSNLKGTLLAGAAITMTGGTFAGNASSKADVTVTGTVVTSCGGN